MDGAGPGAGRPVTGHIARSPGPGSKSIPVRTKWDFYDFFILITDFLPPGPLVEIKVEHLSTPGFMSP